jgi:hypothetical protein
MLTTASRNTPLSNPTGRRGIDCTKLKICTTIHRHRFVNLTVCMNATRLQALYRAPPPPLQPTMPVVKPEGGHAASVKAGQKSYEKLSGTIA